MAKAKKDMTPKERREQLIKDRANRLAKEAAKQGITPAELKKKKRDTFLNVVGGAATMIPVARVMQLANVAYKGYKGAGTAAQAGKTLNKTSKASKKLKSTAKTTGAATKQTAKKAPTQTKAPTKAKTNAKPKTAAKKRPAAKKGTTAAATSRMTSDRAKRAILGGAVASATLATIDDIRKAGKGKAKAATMPSGPKPRPKRSTGMSEGNTVAGSSGRRGSDPRKGFASNATPGAKKAAPKKVATTKSRDKDGQGTGKIGLPAGAKRKFSGGYNSKTEKLRNIGGKTYVFNK